MIMIKRRFLAVFLTVLFFSACSSSDVKDVIDAAEGVPRRTIDVTRMGVNAFANERFAGSICDQYQEVSKTLNIKFVRVLFSWNDGIQPTPQSSPFMGFYDDIVNCLPRDVDALAVLTGVPSWMNDSANWINGNPRQTFVENWVKIVASRYKGKRRIVGYQIGNEPNNSEFPENSTLDLVMSPSNFVELVAMASNAVKGIDSSKLVVNGATTGISQRFPETLDYNRSLRDAGLEEFVDRFAIHYYGTNFEKFLLEVKDFLNASTRPIWVTESGIVGFDQQLAYVEQVWPFLREHVEGVDRIYYYQFAENAPADISFGLKTPDPSFPVSDLYVHLQERAAG
jgi:hypothetical protein